MSPVHDIWVLPSRELALRTRTLAHELEVKRSPAVRFGPRRCFELGRPHTKGRYGVLFSPSLRLKNLFARTSVRRRSSSLGKHHRRIGYLKTGGG